MKKAIDTAYETTAGKCVIGGPKFAAWLYLTGKSPSEDEWKWGVENYRQICEYATTKDISIAVEVLNRFETHLFNTLSGAYRFCSDVGLPNALVQPDTYHISQEEKSWNEVFTALKDIRFDGWLTVEGFTRDSEIVAGLTKIWRDPADSAEDHAVSSLKALKKFENKYLNN